MKKSQLRYSRGYKLKKDSYPKRSLETGKFRKTILFFAWTLFLILVLSYILLFSPLFEIKEIEFSGNYAINENDILGTLNDFLYKKILIFFDYNNIFLAQKNKLVTVLTDEFSQIQSIKIKKNIVEKNIFIEITERKEIGIYCQGELAATDSVDQQEPIPQEVKTGACYYIDQYGVIFEQAPQTSGTLILVINDLSSKNVEIGCSVINQKLLKELVDLREYLTKQLSLKAIDFVIETSVLKELRINTNEGWYILFDPSRSLLDQAENLRLVLEEKIKDERKSLKYIDLRIENRAYYK